jgi:anti-sigma regulatory factor (Ser/Thr protein kinase)
VPVRSPAFHHEALVYDGTAGMVEATAAFLAEGLAAGEPALVAVSLPKIDLLRARLGPIGGLVEFVDMAGIGRNPARIIPVWRAFVERHAGGGRALRGVGEPVWPGRTPDELHECRNHESLLNLAFADGPAWRLLCPYDAATLDEATLDEARRTHPFVTTDGRTERCTTDHGAELEAPLGERPSGAVTIHFGPDDLDDLRATVVAAAVAAGLEADRASDLVLAVTEAATNSILHGRGGGTLRAWRQPGAIVCEVSDRGHLHDPLLGRREPAPDQTSGRGLWLINQLCDLTQLRGSPTGTVLRLHMRTPAA